MTTTQKVDAIFLSCWDDSLVGQLTWWMLANWTVGLNWTMKIKTGGENDTYVLDFYRKPAVDKIHCKKVKLLRNSLLLLCEHSLKPLRISCSRLRCTVCNLWNCSQVLLGDNSLPRENRRVNCWTEDEYKLTIKTILDFEESLRCHTNLSLFVIIAASKSRLEKHSILK